VNLVQHNDGGLQGAEGAARIAAHYGFTLKHLFANDEIARYAIIVEDDMYVSGPFQIGC
jgi:hypothetical protein